MAARIPRLTIKEFVRSLGRIPGGEAAYAAGLAGNELLQIVLTGAACGALRPPAGEDVVHRYPGGRAPGASTVKPADLGICGLQPRKPGRRPSRESLQCPTGGNLVRGYSTATGLSWTPSPKARWWNTRLR